MSKKTYAITNSAAECIISPFDMFFVKPHGRQCAETSAATVGQNDRPRPPRTGNKRHDKDVQNGHAIRRRYDPRVIVKCYVSLL